MGLAIVHGIVHDYEGLIRVVSKPGRGSTFRLYFPILKESVDIKEQDESRSPPAGSEKILVVDDESAIVSLQKMALEGLGYSVTAKTNSQEAFEIFLESPGAFDLVITDQTMPNLPGTELAEKILQIRPDIPIILCTGYSATVTEKNALKKGIKRYVMKPVTRLNLAEIIREVLDEN